MQIKTWDILKKKNYFCSNFYNLIWAFRNKILYAGVVLKTHWCYGWIPIKDFPIYTHKIQSINSCSLYLYHKNWSMESFRPIYTFVHGPQDLAWVSIEFEFGICFENRDQSSLKIKQRLEYDYEVPKSSNFVVSCRLIENRD